MVFDPAALLAHEFPEMRQDYVERDVILYALGVGLGADPMDSEELRFLLETRLSVLPTMAVTLGTLGMWVRDPKFGINVTKLVHSAQEAVFHMPLPSRASIVARARIASVTDRGEGKGAVVVVEREINDALTKTPYCTLRQTLLLRGDGGFGGAQPVRTAPITSPQRPPDEIVTFQTSPRSALIYRLSGDRNPLHADPETALRAGFQRPILHGLASYGIAGWVLLRACVGGDVSRLRSLALRFSNVVYPGDAIEFSVWRQSRGAIFTARVGEREVLDQGQASFIE